VSELYEGTLDGDLEVNINIFHVGYPSLGYWEKATFTNDFF
jgi:hypothetical protein